MIPLALLMDGFFGEPPETLHPVVWMGRTLEFLDSLSPPEERGRGVQMFWGTGIVALVGGVAWSAATMAQRSCGTGLPGILIEAWMLKSCFAYRALEEASGAVISALEKEDLHAARVALRALVSRDRTGMDAKQISAATIESVSENLSDSFTAPLLAYALGGLPAAFVYRAVNTADAMIGYCETHEYTGKTAALTDDFLNLIPARITALSIAAASDKNFRRATRTTLRDHGLTESPNAGWPMSAAAGALGITLEKPGHYRLNANARTPEVRDARRAVSLIRKSALLCASVSFITAICRRNA